ncbi:MAG: galactosyl transferase [Variovorax sp.]|nr:galactosyl transferase [Variovorax sp.]
MLTFIIPVRHPENAKDWRRVKRTLEQTAASIANQDSNEWRAVVVANTGSDLPALPARFTVAWVDFAPNPVHDIGRDTSQWGDRFEAFRYDKGHRVLAGLLHDPGADHYMVVDDDDFVSSRLASFVARHPQAHGWYFGKGYVWTEGGRWIFRHSKLHKACGTTHIVRRDLMKIPATAAEAPLAHVRWLGTHARVTEDFVAAGTPLAPLPFPGAVYRVGHGNAHSQSGTVRHMFFLRRGMLVRPHVLATNLLRLRLLSPAQIEEFGMARAGAVPGIAQEGAVSVALR